MMGRVLQGCLLLALFLGVLLGVFQLRYHFSVAPASTGKDNGFQQQPFDERGRRVHYDSPYIFEVQAPCTPTGHATCKSTQRPQMKEWEVIHDIRKVDFTEGPICVNTPLRKHLRILTNESHGSTHNESTDNYFPMALHMRWRAPIFHDIDSLLPAFGFGHNVPDYPWSIGGYGGQREGVWARYVKSIEGDGIDPAHPVYHEWSESEPYLLVFRDVLVGIDGAVADCKGRIHHYYPGTCFASPSHDGYLRTVAAHIKKHYTMPLATFDKLFVIKQTWGNEFYHFLIECGTRIYPWLDWIIKEDVKVAVTNANGITVDFLSFLGIKKENIISQYAFGQTVYLPNPNPCLLANAFFLRGTRNYIWARLPPAGAERSIVFLSRGGARGRHLLNQAEIIEQINKDFPQEKIEIQGSHLPLKEQFTMLSRAKIVISPHGAGLSNLLACRPDTKVLEITNRYARNFYGELSAKLGLEYHLIKAHSLEKSNNDDMTADVHQVLKIVAKMLELKPLPQKSPNFYLVPEPFPVRGDSLWKYGVPSYPKRKTK